MGRTIAVTGCSTGIGAQLVGELTHLGDRVIGLDIADPTVDVAEFIRVDLSQEDTIRAAAGKLPPIDALVHCAGIPEDVAPAHTVLAVNVFGLRELTRAALPRVADGGSILSISSMAGQRWRDRIDAYRDLLATTDIASGLSYYDSSPALLERTVYSVSKEAVQAYTAALSAQLLGRNIRVNSVAPGLVDTQLLNNFLGAMSQTAKDTIDATVGRPIQPSEISSVMRFLLSDDAALITGQNILVDGGYFAGAEFSSWTV